MRARADNSVADTLQMIKGRVIKGVASNYIVDIGNDTISCTARGRLKLQGEIYIGDFVEVVKERDDYVISKVLPRRNALIRPYVANVDLCFIVIAVVPKPDFILVDKIIINSIMADITPVLLINKADLCDDGFIDSVKTEYQNVLKIIVCSAETGEGIDEILKLSSGKVACLAGQSAVGKSSVLNAVLGEKLFETGELSIKTERGKHTTRQSVIINIDDSYIIDTCGFSMLELPEDFNPLTLAGFYDDFLPFSTECRFKNKCTHIAEPGCAVKLSVKNGGISENRYNRYVELFNNLNDKWRKRYD